MRALYNIFYHKLPKQYFLVLIATVGSLVFYFNSSPLISDKSFLSIINSVALIFVLIGPLIIFLVGASFLHNVRFFINQHFNRSELLQFFFFSQTVKLILAAINYIVLAIMLSLLSKDFYKIVSVPQVDFKYSSLFDYYLLMIAVLFVFYNLPVLIISLQDSARSNTAKINLNNHLAIRFLAFNAIGFAVVFGFSGFNFPDVITYYLVSFVFVFSSIFSLNKIFKFYTEKKSYVISCLGSFIICFPMVMIIFGMRNEAVDDSLSYKARVESVISLNWLNSHFTDEQMLGFLKEVDNRDYREILSLFGNKVDVRQSLKLVDNEVRAKGFIDFHSRPYNEDIVRDIISHMAKLMDSKKLEFGFAQYSHSFFIKQKANDLYIQELIKSGHPYNQLASIYLAKNSFEPQKFLDFYKMNLAILDRSVVSDSFVRRSINLK